MIKKSRDFRKKQRVLKSINKLFIKHYSANKEAILSYILPKSKDSDKEYIQVIYEHNPI